MAWMKGIRTVPGRPVLDWRVREGLLEEETEEWIRVKDKRLGDYIERIQICVLWFLGRKNGGNDGEAIFTEMMARIFPGLKKDMSS